MTMIESRDLAYARIALATPDHVRQAAKDALDAGETHYTVRPGIDPLRRAVAEKLARENDIAVHPKREVLITCGEQEALFVALHVLIERGDEVVLTAPAAAQDVDLVTMANGVPRVMDADPDRGFALDADALDRLVNPKAKVLLLRSPTLAGRVPDAAALQALAEVVIAHDLTVVAVESLELFVDGEPAHRSIAAVPGMSDRTVTINGFAAWGLDGWRVGYLAGPQRLVEPMIALKQALSICSPAVSQYAALAAMTGRQDGVENTRRGIAERRVALLAALKAAGTRCVAPTAGSHVLVDGDSLGDAATAVAALDGVDVTVGETVGLPGWLRIALTESFDAQASQQLTAALGAGTDRKENR